MAAGKKNEKEDELVFKGFPTNSETNRYIRNWVKKAGIAKNISYHTSRPTFGTMMITAGADLYTVSKLMGHSEVRTTQNYAKNN